MALAHIWEDKTMQESIQKETVHTTFSFPDFLPDWANEFYKAKRLEGVSIRTQGFYKEQMTHFLKFCEGQVIEHISQITASTIRDYLIWLEEEGHNPGGVHAAYRVLKTFLRWFDSEAEPVQWRNPIEKVKAPKLAEDPLEPVELKTVSAMIATCNDSFLGKRNKVIFLFLLDTGLRARELLSLNLADVNQVTGAVILRVGKGRKPRSIFISPSTRKAVRAYIRERKDNQAALFVLDDLTERLGYGGLRVLIKKHASLAHVPEPTAHDFRRAFAINCLRNGMDLVTLARLMGHTSLKVLQRYLKMVDGDLHEAHDRSSPVGRGGL